MDLQLENIWTENDYYHDSENNNMVIVSSWSTLVILYYHPAQNPSKSLVRQRTLPHVHVGVQLIPQRSHHCNRKRKGIIWYWMQTVLLIKALNEISHTFQAPTDTLLLYASPQKICPKKKLYSAYPQTPSLI